MTGNSRTIVDYLSLGVASAAALVAAASALYAHEQAIVAKDAEERQLRAYVGVESIGFAIRDDISYAHAIPPPTTGHSGVYTNSDFLVRLKNFGATPARNITLTVDIAQATRSGQIPSDHGLDESTKSLWPDLVSHPTLNAGQSQESAISMTPRNLAMLRAAEVSHRVTLVYGYFVYTDVFDRRWRGTYCYMVRGDLNANPETEACEFHNDEVQADPTRSAVAR